MWMPLVLLRRRPVDQVQQREKENPHHVDEVPVKPEQLHGRVPFGGVRTLPRLNDQNYYDDGPDDHMRRMETRHTEIQGEEQRRVRRIGAAFAIEIVSRNFVISTLR